MNVCPECGSRGRGIGAVTLEAQVVPSRLAPMEEHDGWSVCTSAACDVVYFRDAETVLLNGTLAVPFRKSDDPQRLACFCFEHTVAEIEADLSEHGTSTIQASIKAACREGRDDCERKNPQGRCCLGDVGVVLKAAREAGDGPP